MNDCVPLNMVPFQKAERPGVHKETYYIVPDIGTLSKVIKKSATVQNPSLPRKGTINNLAKCSNYPYGNRDMLIGELFFSTFCTK